MDNKELKILIDKYLKGGLSAQEAARLEQWLDTLANEHAFDALTEEEKTAARQGGYQRLLARINAAQQPAVTKRLFPGNRFLKMAASVAILVLLGVVFRSSLLNLVSPHRLTSMTSRAGDIKKHILSDGSIVWLKGNSKLTFPVRFGKGERAVTLEGEALFEVAKDAAHPFLIYCGTLTTHVLGTSFNIRNNGKETEVAVLTGKVALTTATYKRILLYANERAVYSEPAATIAKDSKTVNHTGELTKGTEYDMAFNDAAMPDVIRRIEKKFEVHIKLQDPAINNNLITADLTDQSLKNTMEMICQALNLDAEISGGSILLQQKK